MYGEHFSTASPEFSTDGTFAKCWTRLDNQIFLMKRGSEGGANAGLEPYSEMYASQLAAVFCPDSVPYDGVNYHEKKASKCPLFTNEQYGFAPIYKCIGVEAGIAQTLQYGLSGQRMGYFYMNGKQYEILGEINRQQRNKPADLKGIYIRSSQGDMVQLDNLIELTDGIAPPKLYRYNRFVSATISAGLADGKTIGQGLDEMDKIAKETLDDTFRTALTGDSKEYRESSSSLMFAFILAILLIYLILAAQFESFKDPLIIMLTVPLAIAGALVFMYFGDITMNIFSQIGIIMLIGLVAKNGILIVEFANQKQEAGEDKMRAIKDASLQRLRPILMTSASTILGLIPLAYATGEGCNQRIAMGTAVVGGMLISTLLTMYIVPAIYSYVSTNRSKLKTE